MWTRITTAPRRAIVVGRDLAITSNRLQKALQPAVVSPIAGTVIRTHGGVALCRSSGVSTSDIILVPEYPGAVACYLSGDAPKGKLTGRFDINTCHNAYNWYSQEALPQTVNIVVRCVHIGATSRFFYAQVADADRAKVALTHIGDTEAVLHQLAVPVECTATSWTKVEFSLPSGTFRPGGLITLVFALTAWSGGEARLGEVYIKR